MNEAQANAMVADTIADRVTTARVKEIRDAVDATGHVGNARDISLVVSGVMLGIEETFGFTQRAYREHVTSGNKVLAHIDQIIQDSGNLEVMNTLAEAMAPFRAYHNNNVKMVYDGMLTAYTKLTGATEAMLTSDQKPEEMPDAELLAYAMQAYLSNIAGFYGFMVAHKEKKIATMKCLCADCTAELFQKSPLNAAEISKQVMAEFGSMDAALRLFGTTVLGFYRRELKQAKQGMAIMHDIDPSAAKDVAAGAIARMFRMPGATE